MAETTTTSSSKKINKKALGLIFVALAAAFVFVSFVLAVTVQFHEYKDSSEKLGIFWTNAGTYLAFMIIAFGLLLAKFIMCSIPAFLTNKDVYTKVKFIMEIISLVLIIASCVSLASPADIDYYLKHYVTGAQTACIVCSSFTTIPVIFTAVVSLKDSK